MNLIEQLAGYSECERLRKVPAASSFRIRGIEFTREELERAMLEHRRANNIFEVGDWVYPLSRILDEHEGIGRFILVEKGELVVVREVKQKGLYVSHEHRHDNSFYVYFNEIRHATDEEIAAGRRLP